MHPELEDAFSLGGRVAVVTGAASGLGRQAAITFAQAGASLVLADRDEHGLVATGALVSELAADGVSAPVLVVTDVSAKAEVDALAGAAIEAFGRLDVWANVAGVIAGSMLVEATAEHVESIVRVNQFGTYWGIAAAGRAMGERGGSIINIASAGGDMPAPGISVYGMTKAAVMHLTTTAAVELGPRGIRVNAIAPGFIDTPMVARNWTRPDGSIDDAARESMLALRAHQSPLGVTGVPTDITYAMLYLAADASRFVTGQVLRPNGGVVMK
jgi:3-oxoacyl-[acyl-carrier protein] reductase